MRWGERNPEHTEQYSPRMSRRVARPQGRLRRWALRFPPANLLRWSTTIVVDRSPADRVPVVIPHWNAPEWCLATVESFRAQVSAECAVVVVDNSADEVHPLRLPDDVEVVRPSGNLGYAGAVNIVLDRFLHDSSCEVIVAACHDAVVSPLTVQALTTALAVCPRAGIVGLGGGTFRIGHPTTLRVSPRVWVSGTCFAVRRACAQSIGLLDEDLGTYDEDLDLCLRAWDDGWDVLAIEGFQASTHGSIASDRTRRIARNHVLLAGKRRGVVGMLAEAAIQWRHATLSALRGVSPRAPAAASRREASQRLVGSCQGLGAAIRTRLRVGPRGDRTPPASRRS